MASDCIEWTGRITPDGYGRQGALLAHRIAYEAAKGPIPEGLVIDHLCRNRCCVNPDHLEAVTFAENVARGERATRDHCAAGHTYTTESTYFWTDRKGRTARHCRTCRRERQRARKAA